MPETAERRTFGSGARRLAARALDEQRMCSGTVPQQPPMRFTQPSSKKRSTFSATIVGVSL